MLLDCFMPDMDGFEVTKQIRLQEKTTKAHLPIIGVSGESDMTHKKLCLMHGMDGVLEKPVDTTALKNVIELWCPVAESIDMDLSPLSISKADLQLLFYETTKQDLDALLVTLESEDIVGAQRLVHRMKGAALTLGKQDIAEQATHLEQLLRDRTIEVHVYQGVIHKIDRMLHK